MFGAILGDIIGSPYEFDYCNIKSKEFELFTKESQFTDDSVMTIAVALGIMETKDKSDYDELRRNIITRMQYFGRKYPGAGYGANFYGWLHANVPMPYNSFGNGSAMRVSSVAWIFDTLEDVLRAAKISAEVSHNHPEGIKGAQATAAAIFLARKGKSKAEIRIYIEKEFGYDLSRTCDEIRPNYRHVESCQETVPEAITAFLEGNSFEDVIRTAVSLGGDSDTLAAIAGSIAEAYYGIEEDWKKAARSYLPEDLLNILYRFDIEYGRAPAESGQAKLHRAISFAEKAHRGQKRKGSDTDYIVHPLEVLQILTTISSDYDLYCAGVLHDTVEDTDTTIEDIENLFGERVAYLVGNHTEDKTKSWRERKQATIDELYTAERDIKLLIMADKLSNLRSMKADYCAVGEDLWKRFNAPKEDQAWYNSAVIDALGEFVSDPDARLVYWELNDIFKDIFTSYRVDFERKEIWQISCGEVPCVFRKTAAFGYKWLEAPDEMIPESAVPTERYKAEYWEDYWAQDL